MKYKIRAARQHSEVDDWENGCIPETSKARSESVPADLFNSPADVLTYIKARTGETNVKDYGFDEGDEPGRIEVQFNSATQFGRKQSAAHAEEWKAGRAKSYLIDWSFYIIAIDEAPVTAGWVA